MADLDDHFKNGAAVRSAAATKASRLVVRGNGDPTAAVKGQDHQQTLGGIQNSNGGRAGKDRLLETLDVVQLRPPPPREACRNFEFSEPVDACYNDGWWEGVITEVLENDRYSVFFRGTREQLQFQSSELRLHREWVKGKWVPPLEEEEKVSTIDEIKLSNKMLTDNFSKGMLVEVSSDEDGFQGAWFSGTIIEQLMED